MTALAILTRHLPIFKPPFRNRIEVISLVKDLWKVKSTKVRPAKASNIVLGFYPRHFLSLSNPRTTSHNVLALVSIISSPDHFHNLSTTKAAPDHDKATKIFETSPATKRNEGLP